MVAIALPFQLRQQHAPTNEPSSPNRQGLRRVFFQFEPRNCTFFFLLCSFIFSFTYSAVIDMDAQMQQQQQYQDASGTDMIALQKVGAAATTAARPDERTTLSLSAPPRRHAPAATHPSVIVSLRVCVCVHLRVVARSPQLHSAPVIPLYSLDNYTFGTKEQQREKDANVKMRMERMERVGRTAKHESARSERVHTEECETSGEAQVAHSAPAVCAVRCVRVADRSELSQSRSSSQCRCSAARAQSRSSAHSAAADGKLILQTVSRQHGQ